MFSNDNSGMYPSGAPSQGMMYAQPYPGPAPNNTSAPMQYAGGGNVMPRQAEMVRSMGQRGDNVLAYINPREAMHLAKNHGMDINPHTGLPQFGLYDSMKNYGNQAYNYLSPYASQAYGMGKQAATGLVSQGLGALDKGVGYALQPIGAQFGTYLGGTSGGMLGGAGGKHLGDMYRNSGGMQGAFDRYMGGKPVMGNPSTIASGIGNAMYDKVGRPLVQQGLGRVDQEVSSFLPRLGEHMGQQMGGGAGGMRIGNDIGQMAANRYNGMGGMAGQQGRMEGMAGMAPQVPAFAEGGFFSSVGNFFGGQNPPPLPPRPGYSLPGGMHPYMPGPALPPRPPMGMPNLPPPPARGGFGPNGAIGMQAPPLPAFAEGGYNHGHYHSPDRDFFFDEPLKFKRGGALKHRKMNNIHDVAERLRSHAEGEDKVLAHINPNEAEELSYSQGQSFNDETGLPQFGGFSNLFRKARKSKFLRKALPLLGSVVGSAIAGPAGALMGGALLKSMAHKNPLKGAMQGALMGGAYGTLAPIVGNALGMSSTSGIGNALSLSGTPGLHRLGLQGLAGLGAGSAAGETGIGGMGSSALSGIGLLRRQQPQLQQFEEHSPQEESGPLSGLLGFGKGAMDFVGGPLNAGLLGATILGASKAKQKRPDERSLREQMQEVEQAQAGQEGPSATFSPRRTVYREPPAGYRPGIDPEWKYYVTIDPTTGQDLYAAEGGYIDGYADGGEVDMQGGALGDYLQGPSGGQEDNRQHHINEGDYILNATDISLLGDGNSEAGALKVMKFLEDLDRKPSKTMAKKKGGSTTRRSIRAALSDGELRIPAEKVEKLGDGDGKKGSKKIDGMRKNLRKHKGVKAILPPKTKPLKAYMKGA